MPIMYVNPAPRRRAGRKVRPLRGVTVGTKKLGRKSAAKKNAARRATKRKGTSMARKLYGAAAKAHAKRLAKSRRKHKRRNPAKKRAARKAHKATRRRARKSSVAAHYHSGARGYAAGMAAAPKKRRRRKARKAAAVAAPKRRRRRKARKSVSVTARRAAARRRYHKKHPGAKRRPGTKALRRARRSIKRARRFGGRAGAYAKRFKMRSNPRRRRARRNPGLVGGVTGPLMSGLKAAVPVAASLYLTRFIIAKVGPSIPMIDRLPGQVQAPVVASLMVVAANFATKKGPLAKYRSGIMLGTSLNLVDTLVKAFAPAEVKTMFGLGDSGMYDHAMGEYTTTSDYLEVGDEPIDDDIALSDYVETSGIEEELGAIQEELGISEELGGSGPRLLGGVSQSSTLRAIPRRSSVGVIPQRSFTKAIPAMGPGYDNVAALQTGIFSGGF
jgi:hypothetical protein